MCQHNKARVAASSRHDKVEDIECLAPDPSGGDKPSGGGGRENGSKKMERQEEKRNDGKKYREGE